MKKLPHLSILLCLVMVLQMLWLPVLATEPTGEPEIQATETVEIEKVPVPDVPYGTANIAYGCRTLDGKLSIGTDDKILETAQAAFVYERNTGTIIYKYRDDVTLSPGALTKILTAIVAMEESSLTDRVTISTANYTSIAGTRNCSLKHGLLRRC